MPYTQLQLTINTHIVIEDSIEQANIIDSFVHFIENNLITREFALLFREKFDRRPRGLTVSLLESTTEIAPLTRQLHAHCLVQIYWRPDAKHEGNAVWTNNPMLDITTEDGGQPMYKKIADYSEKKLTRKYPRVEWKKLYVNIRILDTSGLNYSEKSAQASAQRQTEEFFG